MAFQYLDIAFAFAALAALCLWLVSTAGLSVPLAPLCALSIISAVLSLAGMAGLLRPAGWVMYALCFGMGAFSLIRKKKPVCDGAAPQDGGPAPGAVIFWLFALSMAVCLATRKPLFYEYDEFSLWGTAAKMTSTQNVLYTEGRIGWPWQASQNCGLIALSYFFSFFGEFAPWKVFVAYDTLFFACFAAVLCSLRRRDTVTTVSGAVFCWLTPYVFTLAGSAVYVSHIYISSYGDVPAGLLFGGAVAFWLGLRHTRGAFWPILPVLLLCANIKSNTFVLALAAAGIVSADLLFFADVDSPGLPRRVCRAALTFAVPMGFYMVWNRYIAGLVVQNTAAGGIGDSSPGLVDVAINGVKMLLGLPTAEYYQLRSERFSQSMRGIVSSFLHVPVTLLGTGAVTVVFLLLLASIAVLLAPEKQKKVRICVVWGLCAVCFALYNFMLVLSYAFVFKEASGAVLIDYTRYLGTYYLGWLLATAAMLFEVLRVTRLQPGGRVCALALACVWAVLFCTNVSQELTFMGCDASEFDDIAAYEWRAAEVVEEIRGDALRVGELEDARVFLVCQNDNGEEWFRYSYSFLPLVLDYSGDLSDSEKGGGGGTFGLPELREDQNNYHAYTQQEFFKTVCAGGCGYLYAARIDEVFRESYAALFTDGLQGASDMPTLYRVTPQGFEPVSGSKEAQ